MNNLVVDNFDGLSKIKDLNMSNVDILSFNRLINKVINKLIY